MTAGKGFFRNVFDAIIESRTRQVAREVAHLRARIQPNNVDDAKL